MSVCKCTYCADVQTLLYNILFIIFSIATVELSSTTHLDRELRDAYILIVTVNDGLTSVSHSFTIMVDDVNDETPTFEKDTYVLTSEVLEDSVDGRFSMYNSVRIRYLSAPGIDLETEFEVF